MPGWRAKPSVCDSNCTMAGAGLPVSSESTVSLSRPGAGVVTSKGRRTGGLARPPELERQRGPSDGQMFEARHGIGGAVGRGVQRDEARFTGGLRHIRQARRVAHPFAPGQHFEQQGPGVARQLRPARWAAARDAPPARSTRRRRGQDFTRWSNRPAAAARRSLAAWRAVSSAAFRDCCWASRNSRLRASNSGRCSGSEEVPMVVGDAPGEVN